MWPAPFCFFERVCRGASGPLTENAERRNENRQFPSLWGPAESKQVARNPLKGRTLCNIEGA